MIKTYDFKMTRGETKTLEMTVTDEKGALVDLAGSTCYLRWAPDLKSSPVVLLQGPGGPGGITVLDQTASKGKYRAVLTPTHTHDLPIGEYRWDSWVVLPSGAKYAVVATSVVALLAEVTSLALP